MAIMNVAVVILLQLAIPTIALATFGQSVNSVLFEDYDNTIFPNRNVCGNIKETTRIFGGQHTDLGELPWVVAIEYADTFVGENAGILCVGSLITDQYVLTAANCASSNIHNLKSVYLGDWNLSTNPDCQNTRDCADPVQKFKIEKVIVHEGFNRRTKEHDIALIRLAQSVTFTEFISPICLPPKKLPFPQKADVVTVAGWGKTETGERPDILLKVTLPVVPNEDCSQKLNVTISEYQFCAGGAEGKDSCQGDSGSAAISVYNDKVNQARWYQHGIVSYGRHCGISGVAGVYTRVDKYMDWILKNIKNSKAL